MEGFTEGFGGGLGCFVAELNEGFIKRSGGDLENSVAR